MEVTEDLDGGRLLELATFDGIFRKGKGQDYSVAPLGGREVSDRGGDWRLALGGLAGNAAAGENDGRDAKMERRKWKMEMRDFGVGGQRG